MSREEMLTEVIRARGFEDEWTIKFAQLMENAAVSDSTLRCAMATALSMPIEKEEE